MTWEDLHRMASVARTDLLLLDGCLAAIAESRDTALHGRLTAEVPTVLTLCRLLDEHGISAPGQLEAQIAIRQRLAAGRPADCSSARTRHARIGVGEEVRPI